MDFSAILASLFGGAGGAGAGAGAAAPMPAKAPPAPPMPPPRPPMPAPAPQGNMFDAAMPTPKSESVDGNSMLARMMTQNPANQARGQAQQGGGFNMQQFGKIIQGVLGSLGGGQKQQQPMQVPQMNQIPVGKTGPGGAGVGNDPGAASYQANPSGVVVQGNSPHQKPTGVAQLPNGRPSVSPLDVLLLQEQQGTRV